MMARLTLAAAALIPILLGATGAIADPETDQLREQLRATVLQLRQLQDQMAAAPAPAAAAPPADAAAKARLAAVQAQLRAARQSAARAADLQAQVDKLQAQNTTLTTAASADAAQLENVKTAYAQAVDSGRALAGERDRLKADLAKMTTIATTCQTKNTRLIALSESILTAYRKENVSDVLAHGEPFFGLARVRMENLAQDREDKVRADRCDPRLDAGTPARPGGG
jgi:uncharacterized protein (DUF3084 family)